MRAGVRSGYAGGTFEPVEFLREDGEDEPAGLSISDTSSGTVSGCRLPLESFEYNDSWSEWIDDVFRSVDWLEFR